MVEHIRGITPPILLNKNSSLVVPWDFFAPKVINFVAKHPNVVRASLVLLAGSFVLATGNTAFADAPLGTPVPLPTTVPPGGGGGSDFPFQYYCWGFAFCMALPTAILGFAFFTGGPEKAAAIIAQKEDIDSDPQKTRVVEAFRRKDKNIDP